MLTELRIRNVGVIDDVTLHLAPGLNVLTGETGAGKTMVVSALELLLGARADADRVRFGARAATIEGIFAPPPDDAQEWLDDSDQELIVAREVAAEPGSSARSRARVGGRMAPVSALSACVGAVVEMHGQSDTSRLADRAEQREVLDRFGGTAVADAAASYRTTFAAWRQAQAELTALRASLRDAVREADRLRFELDEIDSVAPDSELDASLGAEVGRLEHAESLLAAAAQAAAAVGDDGGARDALAGATASLRTAAGHDPDLDALARRLESLTTEADDVGLELRRYATSLESDPVRLEALRERQAALMRLSRKYTDGGVGCVDIAGILDYAAQARTQLVALDSGESRTVELATEVERLSDLLHRDASRLRAERESAGKRLAAVVRGHLAELAMEGAYLQVAVEAVDPTPHGADSVAFELAANRGEPALPFGKAASGGERSRVALALRLALADADRTPVLVFDEIDAGIGGATALAVGRKLAALAQGRQVLCVTHLPQLAAYADAHFLVTKGQTGDRTVASVRALDEHARVAEVSRMLSGTPDSAVSSGHAAQLLANARRDVAASGDRQL